MTRSDSEWGVPQETIPGDAVLPGLPAYQLAVAWYHDVWPQAVVLCGTPADVSETISLATRSVGHCFAGRSLNGGIVIDVTAMRSVSVSSGVVTVGAGVRLGEVYDSLAEHGLTIPAGRGERRRTHDS